MNDFNNSNSKKNSTRKKNVDLKAVAALLEDSNSEPNLLPPLQDSEPAYTPNEELIQATQRIRSQKDLISKRIEKMTQSRDRVSKTVFDKIHRDYQLQLDTIGKLLSEKKAILKAELDTLYLLRGKESMELNRHREILEEARFRRFLEEFTEEQYKEVEHFEAKEIESLEGELTKINSYIKLHEELFDEPASAPSPAARTASDVTRTVAAPQAPAPATQIQAQASSPSPRKGPTGYGQLSAEDLSEKTPIPESLLPSVETAAPVEIVPQPEEKAFDDSITQSRIPLFTEENEVAASAPKIEEDYFNPNELMNSAQTPASFPAPFEPETGKTILREPDEETFATAETASVAASAELGVGTPVENESIFDILENSIDEPEGLQKIHTPSLTPIRPMNPILETESLPEDIQTPATNALKLVFTQTEGEEMADFILKDNVSIGRSPSNDLALKAPKVSRQHAAINKYKDQYILIDLKSSNGVFVNGRKIDEHALEAGDEVSIGGYRMKVVKA